MTSENTKIIINEVDKTKPGGSGIAPSDIVFVPGFSVLPDAPKNTPILVNDYLEFEKYFGTTPAVLTSIDVKNYTSYGFNAGDFDKSYIYAKEILLQGTPVVYSNIESNDTFVQETHVALDPKKTINTTPDFNKYVKISDSASSNDGAVNGGSPQGFIRVQLTESVDDGALTFKCVLPKLTLTAMNNNQPVPVTLNLRAILKCANEDTDVTCDAYVNIDSMKLTNVNYKKFSPLCYEFYNTTTNPTSEDCSLTITLNIKSFTKNAVESMNYIDLYIYQQDQTNGSRLDAFYDTSDTETKTVIKTELEKLHDKSVYSVKYITSGGYPSVVMGSKDVVLPFASEMITAAATRGDAVALIDYMFNPEDVPFSKYDSKDTFYAKMISAKLTDIANPEYGAMFYPWGNYSCGSSLSNVDGLESDDVYMPPSFAYMICLAKAIKTSPNWLAMAGVSRGIVPKLNNICTPANVLSNAIAEEMQPKFGKEGHNLSINCITNIRPYGLTLWGNRTMKAVNKEGCVALNFLNTRNMLSDIKKVLYSTAKSLMFEQNSDTLWLRFKSGITPLLDRLKTGNGLEDYRIVRGTTKYNGDPLQKGEISAVIKIYPLYAVEYFELTVEINDKDVTVV